MKKIETESLQRLSIFAFKKVNLLLDRPVTQGKAVGFIDSLGRKTALHFSISTQALELIFYGEGVGLKIELATTACNYGGVRYWFICPMERNGLYCKKRVGILYNLSSQFCCRHCGGFTYSSRNQSKILKCNVSILDLNEAKEDVGRNFYNGKPTRKYKRLVKMENEFQKSLLSLQGYLKGKNL